VSADPRIDGAAIVALLERLLVEVLELHAKVDALHSGRRDLDSGRAIQQQESTTKQIVDDLEIALTGKIPERNMASTIARKTGMSDRQVRRLRGGK
jgi:hypothetical protein